MSQVVGGLLTVVDLVELHSNFSVSLEVSQFLFLLSFIILIWGARCTRITLDTFRDLIW